MGIFDKFIKISKKQEGCGAKQSAPPKVESTHKFSHNTPCAPTKPLAMPNTQSAYQNTIITGAVSGNYIQPLPAVCLSCGHQHDANLGAWNIVCPVCKSDQLEFY